LTFYKPTSWLYSQNKYILFLL